MYKKQQIHFVGIGGVGMSGIAQVLLNLGYPVTGSDVKNSSTTRSLKKLGAKIYVGHKPKNIEGAKVVVVSSAIKKDNPEYIEAHKLNIPVVQRAEMLSELMRFSRYGIAVSGTHGKTTTTSLIANMLFQGGIDPTIIIGGRVKNFKSNARLGKGEFMVAEADESDGSFLKLSPSMIVITNIDREHMDFYGSFEKVVQSYLDFTQKLPFYGVAICCLDHPIVREIIPQINKRVITYGFHPEAMIQARNLTHYNGNTTYDLYVNNEFKSKVDLQLLGEHNVCNSLACIAVALEVGVSFNKVLSSFKKFKGIERRCEVLLKNKQVTIIDDYGHHPEEIKATLKAIRQSYDGRLVTFFQPHRYSRTKDLFNDFVGAFDKSDLLLITDIYAAGETAIDGIHSKSLSEAIASAHNRDVTYMPKDNALIDKIADLIIPGDVVVSLGAGDITKMGRELAKLLKKNFKIQNKENLML